MSKKCYRFFGGLFTVQKNWLNKMAEKGIALFERENYSMNLKNVSQVKFNIAWSL